MGGVQPLRVGPADLRLPPVVARMATWPPLAAVALALLAGLIFPATSERAGPWLFAVAVVVGLPHGAADHLLPLWSGLSLRPRQWVVLLAAYVAAAGVALAWMLGEPRVALVLLALAALHLGCGEVAVAALRSGRPASRARAPRWRLGWARSSWLDRSYGIRR